MPACTSAFFSFSLCFFFSFSFCFFAFFTLLLVSVFSATEKRERGQGWDSATASRIAGTGRGARPMAKAGDRDPPAHPSLALPGHLGSLLQSPMDSLRGLGEVTEALFSRPSCASVSPPGEAGFAPRAHRSVHHRSFSSLLQPDTTAVLLVTREPTPRTRCNGGHKTRGF